MAASFQPIPSASGVGQPQIPTQGGLTVAETASGAVFESKNRGLNDSLSAPASSSTAAANQFPAAGSGINLEAVPAVQALRAAAGENTEVLVKNESATSFFTKIRDECKQFCTDLRTGLKEEYSKPGFWKKVAAAILGAVAFPLAFAMKAYKAAGEVLNTHKMDDGFMKSALKVSAGIAGFVGAMLLAVIPKVGFVAGMGGGAIIGYQAMARKLEAELAATGNNGQVNSMNKV